MKGKILQFKYLTTEQLVDLIIKNQKRTDIYKRENRNLLHYPQLDRLYIDKIVNGEWYQLARPSKR